MAEIEGYLQELSRFQGSISVLLENLQRLIQDLPDRRDQEGVKQDLSQVLSEIEEIKDKLLDQGQQAIKDYLDNRFQSCSECRSHINNISGNLEKITSDEQVRQLGDLFEVVKNITEESNKIKVILEQEDVEFKTSDVFEFVKFVRQQNKKSEFWAGTKAKIIIVIGTMVAFLTVGDKFVTGVTKLVASISKLFQ